MSFIFYCPHCNQKIEAEDEWIGQAADCPACGRTITIQKTDNEQNAQRILKIVHENDKEQKIDQKTLLLTGGVVAGIVFIMWFTGVFGGGYPRAAFWILAPIALLLVGFGFYSIIDEKKDLLRNVLSGIIALCLIIGWGWWAHRKASGSRIHVTNNSVQKSSPSHQNKGTSLEYINNYEYVSQEDSANLYNFDFKTREAYVTGYKGNGPDMNIPSSAGGKPVTWIAYGAFKKNHKIVRVSIPGSISSIGNDAFMYCDHLTQITIPGNVKIIGGSAFFNCVNLSDVWIQDGVEEIRSLAFADCPNLTNITIPDSVKRIDSDAFGGCSKLKSITISKDTYFGGYEFYKALPLQINYR